MKIDYFNPSITLRSECTDIPNLSQVQFIDDSYICALTKTSEFIIFDVSDYNNPIIYEAKSYSRPWHSRLMLSLFIIAIIIMFSIGIVYLWREKGDDIVDFISNISICSSRDYQDNYDDIDYSDYDWSLDDSVDSTSFSSSSSVTRSKKTYIDENGYKRFVGSKKLVHRWVAEKKIGRKLRKGEVVHHINRKKWDNDPDNLEVMSKEEHYALHKDFIEKKKEKKKWWEL